MGICQSSKKDSKALKESIKEQIKKVNPHSRIRGESKKIIIKSLSDINGDCVNIDTCVDTTIIILDFSSQVTINECKNCSIFIAPCKGSISLRKSEGINLISASMQLRCSDVSNSKLSIYSNTQPALERTRAISLGCFFFSYIELKNIFQSANLNVWDNYWSEVHDFTPPSSGNNMNFFTPQNDNEFMKFFLDAMKDQATNIDQFDPVPFSKGLSIVIDKSFNHALVLLEEEVDKDFYNFISEEELDASYTSLVKTLHISPNTVEFNLIVNALKENNAVDKLEFFNSFKRSPTINKTKKDGYILLWLVNDKDKFNFFLSNCENNLENHLLLFEEDLANMNQLIKKLFKNFSVDHTLN